MKPAIVVSLDFELRWGMLGVLGDDMSEYRENLEGVEEVVPRLLDVFRKRGVRATWATVGAVASRNWDEWHARAPPWPLYKNPVLAWRDSYRRRDPGGRLHFAPHLIDAIVATGGQELGSHTFSHAYFREPGFTREDACADTEALIRMFRERWGATVLSCVFPRNQVAHTDVLRERGIVSWRNNPTPFYWNAATEAEQTPVVRALRFADGLLPLGSRAYDIGAKRSSYFVRLNLPPMLWRQHCRRMLNDARTLRENETLHVWFHPHNIGANPRQGVARVAQLLDAVREKAPSSARFMSMGDIAVARGDAHPSPQQLRAL